MEPKYGSRRKTSSGRGLVIAAFLSFLIGGALAGYIVWYNLDDRQSARAGAGAGASLGAGPVGIPSAKASGIAGSSSPSSAPSSVATPSPSPLAEALDSDNAEQAVEAVSRVAEQQGGLDQRLAAAEQRLTRLDLQAQAAAGNAARAEALLIAFATRRLIERGEELGYLADQLRLRFGDERPNAVNTIISFSRSTPPLRLDSLIARLDGLAPRLRETSAGPSWSALKRELGNLFIIRREDTPSSQPEKRLERARFALEQGRYASAIEEVRAMPGAAAAQSWIADAERYKTVMEALENIETAAVLDQRGIRDGEGNRVDTISLPAIAR